MSEIIPKYDAIAERYSAHDYADAERYYARRARLVVDNPESADRMTLNVEVAADGERNAEEIVASIRDITKLRGEVVFRASGELPNDGKVIDDVRTYE